MSQVTIQKLLEPISKEVPCGEILEDNPDFFILKDMLDGKEETQWSPYEPPDWKNILRMSKGLLLKGKDLWVVVIFVYASTEIYGLEGLKKGLEFLRDMTTKYWSDIQPELDGENEDDFTLMRLNPLATMASEHEHLCKMLKGMRLIETQRIGKFNYNDIKVLADETAVRSEALANVEIEHIAADLKQEKYEETVSLLKDCIKIVKEIDDFITEKVGEKNNVSDLSKLISFMNDMMKTFRKCTETGEEGDESEQDSGNDEVAGKSSGQQSRGKNGYSSEKDILKELQNMCSWYKKNLSISPVPILLNKAINVIGKDFIEALTVLMEGKSLGADLNTNISFWDKNSKKNVDVAPPEKRQQQTEKKEDVNSNSNENKSENNEEAVGPRKSRDLGKLTNEQVF